MGVSDWSVPRCHTACLPVSAVSIDPAILLQRASSCSPAASDSSKQSEGPSPLRARFSVLPSPHPGRLLRARLVHQGGCAEESSGAEACHRLCCLRWARRLGKQALHLGAAHRRLVTMHPMRSGSCLPPKQRLGVRCHGTQLAEADVQLAQVNPGSGTAAQRGLQQELAECEPAHLIWPREFAEACAVQGRLRRRTPLHVRSDADSVDVRAGRCLQPAHPLRPGASIFCRQLCLTTWAAGRWAACTPSHKLVRVKVLPAAWRPRVASVQRRQRPQSW